VRSNDPENLKKIYFGNFEKNAPKFFGWGTFGVYPLRGSRPQILFLIIIPLGALRQTNFVWGESAHIGGSYGGLKIAYFGLFYRENLNSDFGFFNADRQSLGPYKDSENLNRIAIPRFEKNAPKIGGWGTFGVYPLRGSGPQILFLIIIALGALRQTNFVWGNRAIFGGAMGV